MQFFIGILPSDNIKQEIISFQKKFKNNRVPFIAEPHITVKAQSGLNKDMLWLSKVESVVKNSQLFDIKLENVGDFNNKVIFLKPSFSEQLIKLHKELFKAIEPGDEMAKKYFENDKYAAHLTLGEGLPENESILMKQSAKKELLNFPTFKISFVRIFQQDIDGGSYHKFLDIPLKIKNSKQDN